MAFTQSTLEHVAGIRPGKRMFHYTSETDTLITIDTAGYFNAAMSQLAVGDFMLIRGSNGNGLAMVNLNDGVNVDTTNATAVTVNTD